MTRVSLRRAFILTLLLAVNPGAAAQDSTKPETLPAPPPLNLPAVPLPAGSGFTPATPPSVAPALPPVPQAPAPQLAPGVPPVAVRGLWVDAFGAGLKNRVQVRQVVEDAARMGVNVLFVQAIRRGDCLCLKSGLPAITDADFERNFDPLALVTRLAHEKGIRVIAWASVTGIANVASPSTNPKHVMRTNGPNSRDSWLARRSDGSWQEGSDGWLDAGIPAAAEYAATAVANLVKNYDVDGVQLDRIRYPDGGDWGYDPKTVARFNAETGTKGRPLPADPQWQQWKREQVTALVRRIALEVKSVRPSAWMTAATITYGNAPRPLEPGSFRLSRPYTDVMQDWPTWIYQGLIDLNVPMNYKRDTVADQGVWFNNWNSFASSVRTRADGQVTPLAVGTALYLNSPEVTASQANRSVAAGLGWVGYSYRVPTLATYNNTQSQPQGLTSVMKLLTAPGGVLSGSVRWQDAPPLARGLMGRVVGVPWLGGRSVEVWQNGQVVAQGLTDGNGYYGFLTLPAGRTEVRIGDRRWTDTVPESGLKRLPDLLLRDTQPAATSGRPSAPGSASPAQTPNVPTPPRR
ncbi:glycoside hydrolase family 10 protein [Deinococcus cavernae]|uniref:Glycoside hydrolase family 10 protein n=1 Tax=Deinococcus cavernae TaxID=2320857 RepID=A0A418V7R6_9DEIO|nr:family 10 glycosylhydrolase [Deinococcus cavernae]RJF72127.1 glycoside hydrolase family 10 protein [Deinococcus cavernae]